MEFVAQRRTRSAYFAGIFYAVNPFTYDRFMDGQYLVLLGYALLPFFVVALFKLCFYKYTDRLAILKLSAWTLAISIVSIHAVGYMAVLALAAAGVAILHWRRDTLTLKAVGKALALWLLSVLILSSFWIIPMLSGSSSRTSLIEQFDERHLLSFRTDGANDLAVALNTAALQGYWGEREGRFYVPRQVIVFWPLLILPVIALVGYGFWLVRKRPEAQVLALSAGVGLVLAVGIAAWPFSEINRLLIDHVPFFRSFREPQKFVSLIVLAYVVFGGIGLMRLKHYGWLVYAALLLPFIYTPGFLWAFGNQLQSSNYPADWYVIKKNYIATAHGNTLFLPWHQYMYVDFVGRVIANPAPAFFGNDKVIAGDNAEIGLIKRQTSSPETRVIESLLENPPAGNLGEKIASLNAEYILLSKNADWRNYLFLDNQGDLELIIETDSVKLYKNLSYKL
jgi:hypothetical protein